jgi:hypothetical protein
MPIIWWAKVWWGNCFLAVVTTMIS